MNKQYIVLFSTGSVIHICINYATLGLELIRLVLRITITVNMISVKIKI